MSAQANPLRNPLFRWGAPAVTAAVIAGMALFLIEDRTLRFAMLAMALLDVILTPQILKRAARSA
ncbi:hypothetical protein [Natronomonas sp.]|uniref:hypothetical protein n=1 Tax=Natronomonas sp. TaxID=2184060 RepID=UPI002620B863|nr:hypothetical protein [Natronomonas sp.]